jgi:hypothetical protein
MCRIGMRVNQKVRLHSEYFLIHQFFIQKNFSHEKTEQCPNFPHSHPDGSSIWNNILQVDPHLQHRIVGSVNGTTVRSFLHLRHFGICDHKRCSFRGPKRWKMPHKTEVYSTSQNFQPITFKQPNEEVHSNAYCPYFVKSRQPTKHKFYRISKKDMVRFSPFCLLL